MNARFNPEIERSMYKTRWALTLICGLSLVGPSAWADRGGGMNRHELTTGGGISAPSGLQALGLNPAGLVYNRGTRIMGELGSPNSDFSPLGAGGRLVMGNGQIGAGLSYRTFTSGAAGRSQIEYGEAGLAAQLIPNTLAIGVSGLNVLGPGDSAWTWNAGLIWSVLPGVRLGATAFGLSQGPDAYGAGLAIDIASGQATLSVDASADDEFERIRVLPALAVHFDVVQLSIGYGFDLEDTPGGNFLPDGVTAGVGLRVTQRIRLFGQYQLATKYLAGLAIQL